MPVMSKLKQRLQRMLHADQPGSPAGPLLPVMQLARTVPTSVDEYWNRHTVNSTPFESASESLAYLRWRAEQYPLFEQLMDLYGQHDDEVILDYGCGPGNDLVGFLVHTRARKVIGVDISETALDLARHRLALHAIDPARVELIRTSDARDRIPFEDDAVDYIYCEGVLHHTSHPEAILAEFYRVLQPSGRACIMVYNRDSLWLHLYTAYDKMVVQNAFPGLTLEEAFSKNTDGEECPIARCYSGAQFVALCQQAGFEADFLGGYLSLHELQQLKELGPRALNDPRLAEEHRAFLRALQLDANGYPLYRGKYAGIGGVYRLVKPDGCEGVTGE